MPGGTSSQATPDHAGRGDETTTQYRWLCACALLALVLGAAGIGRASLWTDELFSRAYESLLGWHFMVGPGLRIEPTPPTHAILLHGWMKLFGDSAAAVRSLSLAGFVAALPAVALLGQEIAGARAARAAMLLYACDPMAVYFAQEARVYALTLLPAALLLWSVAVLLRAPASRKAALAYTLCAPTLIYLHASCLFFVASCAACLAVGLSLRGGGTWRAAARWGVLNGAVALLSLPYAIAIVRARHAAGLDWMPRLSLAGIASVLTSLFTGMLTPHAWPGAELAAAVILTGCVSLWACPVPQRTAVVLIAIPALYFAMLCAESVIRPVLLARVLCWMVIPIVVLAGRQIAAGGAAGKALGALLLLTNATGLVFHYATPNQGKEPWREALAAASPLMRPDDLLVLGPHSVGLTLRAYAPRQRNVHILASTLKPTSMTAINQRLGITPITAAEVRRRIAAGDPVWMIAISFDWSDLDRFKREAAPSYDRKWPCGLNTCLELAGWLPVSPR